MNLSIVLPTYNEKGNIKELILKIDFNLRKKIDDYEIIVVDDSSPDGTAEEVKKIIDTEHHLEKKIKLIKRKEKGLASAVLRGIKESTKNYILIMDTDFNHPPEKISEMLVEAKDNTMVIGSRYIKGGGMGTSKMRYYGSYCFNLLIRILLNTKVKDNLSGFLLFNKKILENKDLEKIFEGYGDFAMRLIYYCKDEIVFKEIPVVYEIRHWGESKTDLIKTSCLYLKQILKLWILK